MPLVLAIAFGCAPAARGGQGPSDLAEAAESLFAVPPVRDTAKVGLGFFSHAQLEGARDHVHADDFVLAQPARVEAVRVWALAAGAPAEREFSSLFDSVTVRIHAAREDGEAGGVGPGDILAESTRNMSQVHARATGRFGSGQGEAIVGPEVELTSSFDVPLRLEANRRYFVSVFARRREADVHFQWQDGETRDAITWSRALADSTWQAIDDVDSAFELFGVPLAVGAVAP